MRHILRNMTAFVQGSSLHLEVEELTPPAIVDVTESYRGGGMLGEVAVPLGFEMLEAEMKLTSWNVEVMKRVGLAAGQRERITFRGYTVSEIDGSEHAVMIVLDGRLSATPEAWTAGGKGGVSYAIGSITYYKHVQDQETIHEIDLLNAVQIVGGVDQAAGQRAALGFI